MARRKKKKTTKTAWYASLMASVVAGISAAGAFVFASLMRIAPERETFIEWLRSRAFRVVATTLVAIALFVGGLSWMRGTLEQQERYRLDPARISLNTGEITWAEGTSRSMLETLIEDDLQAGLSRVQPASAFDTEVLAEVAGALQRSSWVSEVHRVERRFPTNDEASALHIDISVRKPVLMVEMDYDIFFVDRGAVVLPYHVKLDRRGEPSDYDANILAGLSPTIRKVREVKGAKPTPGQVWNNPQVFAAIDVESVLRHAKVDKLLPIDSLDVGDVDTTKVMNKVAYASGGGVRILPHRDLSDAVIVWGRANVHSTSVEPTIEAKLTRLKSLLTSDSTLERQNIYRLNRLQ